MKNNTICSQIPAINAVEGFEPSAFTRSVTNDDGSMSLYLDVKFRMLWFRLRCPDGKLDTEVLSVSDQSAVVCCKVYTNKVDAADQYIAKSVAQRFASHDKYGNRFLEIAETAAIGRALAAAGFGTQFCSYAEAPASLSEFPVDQSVLTGDEANCDAAARPTAQIPQHSTPGMEPAMVMTPVPQQPAPQMQTAAQMPYHAPQQVPVMQGCPSDPPYQPAAPVQPPQVPVQQVPQTAHTMTLDEAKKVVVDFGKYKGFTLGQVAMTNPGDLQWYAERYVGTNEVLKAAAAMLVSAARQMAG